METEFSDPDAALAEVTDLAKAADQADLAAFIELMDERGYTEDDGSGEIEDLDDVTIPIHGEDRTLTALLAFSAGAAIERKYTDHEQFVDETRDVTSVQG